MAIINNTIREAWLAGTFNTAIAQRAANRAVRFGVLSEEGRLTYVGGGSCHGGVRGNLSPDTLYIITSLTHRNNPMSDADYRLLHYVLNDSWFADLFVEKDAREVFRNGAVMTTHRNGSFWLGGGQMVRAVANELQTAFSIAADFWAEAPELDAHSILALAYSLGLARTAHGNIYSSMIPLGSEFSSILFSNIPGHSPFAPFTNFSVAKRVIKRPEEDFQLAELHRNSPAMVYEGPNNRGGWLFSNNNLLMIGEEASRDANWDPRLLAEFKKAITSKGDTSQEPAAAAENYELLWPQAVALVRQQRKRLIGNPSKNRIDSPENFITVQGIRSAIELLSN